jgi:DNA-binding IscR family transcriptional regulator
MGLSKMLSNLMQRVRDMFRPYTLEDFMEDADPKDYKDIQRLEAVWQKHRERKLFDNCY